MKTLIFILALTLSTSYLTAQEKTLKKGMKNVEMVKGTYYRTDATFLDKYLGIWSNSVNGKDFKFKIFKQKTPVQGIYIDRLKAKYCFGNSCDVENIDTSILSSAEKDNIETLEKGILRFMFFDNNYEKLGTLEFKLLKEDKASWKLIERGGFRDESFRKGFSVPAEMILTRIK
ncbi:DUF6705 family protein [Psychroflexus montanilacus]|uniref:DUF6705 family protein n=1 Tax=Psychroflexus montanilacus TaxID=2873598 RepID=UPI001CCC0454|nr:DUF6705 family protein [Psychroflexus montanilacus]MBZ9652197.1 hypothetical protein [Psychroflexus montanilacus]